VIIIIIHADDSRVSSGVSECCVCECVFVFACVSVFVRTTKTKTAENKITKLGIRIVHHDISLTDKY